MGSEHSTPVSKSRAPSTNNSQSSHMHQQGHHHLAHPQQQQQQYAPSPTHYGSPSGSGGAARRAPSYNSSLGGGGTASLGGGGGGVSPNATTLVLGGGREGSPPGGNPHLHHGPGSHVRLAPLAHGPTSTASTSSSGSFPALKSPTNKSTLLNPQTQQLLQESWDLVSTNVPGGHVACVQRFYRQMLSQGGDHIRKLFAYTDMHKQEHMLSAVVRWALGQNFNEEGLQRLGVLHAHLGVAETDLDLFSRCFIETLRDVSKERWRPEYDGAWATVFKDITKVVVPSMHEANALVEHITRNDMGGGGFEGLTGVSHAQSKLIRWFRERITPDETGVKFVKTADEPSLDTKVEYGYCRTPLTTITQTATRSLELHGRLLYIIKPENSQLAAVIDFKAVTAIDVVGEECIITNPFPAINSGDHSSTFVSPGQTPTNADRKNMGPMTFPPIQPQRQLSSGDQSGSQVNSKSFQSGSAGSPSKNFTAPITNLPNGPLYIIRISALNGSTMHFLVFTSQTMSERWLAALTRHHNQFSSHAPAPARNTIDQLTAAVFSEKEHLSFKPTDFDYLTLVGKGSFGKVCKVRHKGTNRIYAMKIISKANFQTIRNVVEVRRERAILETVNSPFIVKFYGFFQSEERLYFLFDFLSGGELFYHTKCAPNHHFSEETARFYLAEIACALEHLRLRNIVHRDIKGDNFVLDADGHVVLTDFGFAKAVDKHKRNTATCGTLAYIAPEVLAPGPSGYGYEVDWWSLGVVMFTMLTGFFPFLRQTPPETAKAIVYEPLRFPATVELTHNARSLCRRLMHKNPQERITSLAMLQQHAFFAGFDWERLISRQMTPPFVPDATGTNTKYFSSRWTQDKNAPNGAADEDAKATPSNIRRENNVFSSMFWEQEEFASEPRHKRVQRQQQEQQQRQQEDSLSDMEDDGLDKSKRMK